jgi:Ca2+-binding EF-hand superfamily protein
VPLEKRTRVEVFLPIRSDTVTYRTVTEWLAEELAFSRGGSTLTTPFTGLYSSTTETTLTHDQVQVLFCDFDLDSDDLVDRAELLSYLNDLRLMLMEILQEEDVWIIYHSVTRIS